VGGCGSGAKKTERPVGGAANTITFPRVTAPKLRVVFTHQGKSRSGVTEIRAWKE
jgi:hypothetical protein